MKYIFLMIALCGCNWLAQEQMVEDVVETVIKDEIGSKPQP